MELTGKQVRHLRALAHPLKPVVQVGDNGVSAAVIEHTEQALEDHELIKVKVAGDRDDVKAAAEVLVRRTGAVQVQIIGKTIVLYKRRAKDPEIELP